MSKGGQQVYVRVPPKQRALVRAAARAAGVSVSEWVRMLVIPASEKAVLEAAIAAEEAAQTDETAA